MAGVTYGKTRKKAPVLVDLVSPTGARITVSEERAETLLNRSPIDLPPNDEGKVLRRGYEYDETDEESSHEKTQKSTRSTRVEVKKDKDGDK